MSQAFRNVSGVVPPPIAMPPLPAMAGSFRSIWGHEERLTGRRICMVDPADARVWQRHGRAQTRFNERNCGDLIASFRAQGRQENPAVVRLLHDDPLHRYEVICGARRLWAAAWVRAHENPEFSFLVEIREMDDEGAFLLCDLDSRTRRDISDYERARDYAQALEWYYGGSVQRMAERLKVGQSWLSRFLELARLPMEVVRAFGSSDVIGISHGAALAPVLRLPPARLRVLEASAALAAEQAQLFARTGARIAPAEVLERLVKAARRPRPKLAAAAAKEHVIRDGSGSVVALCLKAARGGGATIRIPEVSSHDSETVLQALGELLDWLSAGPAANAV